MSNENVPRWKRDVPEHLNTQQMYDEAVRIEPYSLEHVPGRFKTQEMCNEAVRRESNTLWCVPDHLKNKGMCKTCP